MPSNPSLVWGTLAVPNPAQGGIPFIYTDNATPVIDVLNLFWNQLSHLLSIGTSGDQTGTDTVNLYRQVDCYLPVASQTLATPATLVVGSNINGLSISSSQGTGGAPLSNLTGDILGIVGAWSYQSIPVAYVPLAAEYFYARGTTPGNLGGEIHWATKANGAAPLVDRFLLDNLGQLQPSSVVTVANTSMVVSARLGAASAGFGALSLAYVLANVTGNVTQNTPAGQVQIAAGAKSVTVTNNLVTANSVVIAQLQTVDGTLLKVLTVVPAAGSFTINCDVNATGTVKIGYLVIGTDS
jgi:hypothetical protein